MTGVQGRAEGAPGAPSLYEACPGGPVVCCSDGFATEAGRVAQTLSLPFAGVVAPVALDSARYALHLDDGGWALCASGRKAPGPVRCDFVAGGQRHRRLYGGGKSQAIARAVGVRGAIRPTVADLTAGLGGDAFVLASLGCRMTLVERHPVVALLLEDGLRRAAETARARHDTELEAIIGRMDLVHLPARQWLQSLTDDMRPQVIYLDPMFPEKKKKSAQVNKAMQAFQQLVGGDEDADQLLPLALAAATHRVVVKRPAQAPFLDGQAPGYQLKGKSVRFDIYPLKKLI